MKLGAALVTLTEDGDGVVFVPELPFEIRTVLQRRDETCLVRVDDGRAAELVFVDFGDADATELFRLAFDTICRIW